ncbi:CAAX amino terminal protease [Haloarcula hispanica N601]|uniref:CAAX amino terminal protease n=3 Tax=Haloarcula hispanica TaxID=51589 RepID=V5TJJ4_HALHI|nr:CPBP family intramembrane glutamic endopeptidase [Haloarcula hispanica]AEM56706.1 CAAX amino terminal protease family protein [Haloarcula hispanica ATCC 33960]AHB65506.1 CAAX amino terminal protease [Haloarcula hispanica N601]KAA9409414.1 CPBP family intramembrane metalloprotease [Haloarcula hispanica]
MATATRDSPILQAFQYGFTLFSALSLGVIGLGFGSILLLTIAFSLSLGAGVQITQVQTLVLGLITVQGIGCPVIAYTYIKLRPVIRTKLREVFSYSADSGEFDIGVSVPSFREAAIVVLGYASAMVGLVVVAVIITTLVSMFGIETATNQAAEIGMENPDVLLLLIPASFLLIGPGEELLFRGVVQGRIRDYFGPISGVTIASVIFAGIHYPALSGGSVTGKLVGVCALLIPSLILGATYEYTDNIVVPSLIHGAYNATLFTGLYVTVKFSGELSSAAGVLSNSGF